MTQHKQMKQMSAKAMEYGIKMIFMSKWFLIPVEYIHS